MASSSRAGMTTGGWLTIRYRPLTTSPSFASACKLSRVCVFDAFFFARCAPSLAWAAVCLDRVPLVTMLIAAMRSCSVSRAYQISMLRISANSIMASRYADTEFSVAEVTSDALNPLLRPAMAKLAAIRFTSYSNGPGRVSSKSLRSKSNVRSGDANAPKFER